MTLFDPGWRGEQAKGPEDWGVADLGNDPMGILDRYTPVKISYQQPKSKRSWVVLVLIHAIQIE